MSELLPCPFCGTSVVGIEHDGLYRWVECGNMDCNAAGKVFAFLTDVGNADHIVANNWNTRPIEDGLRAELARLTALVERLKEDAERLAKYCQHIPMPDTTCGMSSSGAWNCNCGATEAFYIHRTLMKELE